MDSYPVYYELSWNVWTKEQNATWLAFLRKVLFDDNKEARPHGRAL